MWITMKTYTLHQMSYWKLINWWENQTWNNSFSHPGVHWIMIKECIDDNNWTGSRENKLLPLGNLQLSTLQKGLQKENEGSFFPIIVSQLVIFLNPLISFLLN